MATSKINSDIDGLEAKNAEDTDKRRHREGPNPLTLGVLKSSSPTSAKKRELGALVSGRNLLSAFVRQTPRSREPVIPQRDTSSPGGPRSSQDEMVIMNHKNIGFDRSSSKFQTMKGAASSTALIGEAQTARVPSQPPVDNKNLQ